MADTLHTIVGFVAEFPVVERTADPAGKELAGFVHGKFLKAGLLPSAPEDYEGWAWDICCTEGATYVTTRVGLVDDTSSNPPRQWLIVNEVSTIKSLLKGLFHRRNPAAEGEESSLREVLLRKVCETLHRAIEEDSRFSHIRWYNERTFDKPGDAPRERP